MHGVRVSLIMPFTWFVQIPGLADFREANRFTELGLVPAALLAGAAVEWLRAHARAALFPVLTLAVLEAGWPGNPGIGTMPTALPRLDGPIAAQHTKSIVVDVPFGIRGGLPVIGGSFPAESLVLATADQHPLADAFISRIPASTLAGIEHNPFYAALLNAQGGHHRTTAAQFTAAAASARRMNVGWVLVWRQTRAGTAGAPADRLPVRLPGRRRAGVPAGRHAGRRVVRHPAAGRQRSMGRGHGWASRSRPGTVAASHPRREPSARGYPDDRAPRRGGSLGPGRPAPFRGQFADQPAQAGRGLPAPGRTARTGSGPAGTARPATRRPRPGCPPG